MNIFNVYVDCLDPDMPRLCLFAKREIKKGEQISFDYRQSTGNTDSKNTIKGDIKYHYSGQAQQFPLPFPSAHADLIASPTKKAAILEEVSSFAFLF